MLVMYTIEHGDTGAGPDSINASAMAPIPLFRRVTRHPWPRLKL